MSQPNKQAQALTFANDIVSAVWQIRQLQATLQSIIDRQATLNYAAVLQAMPTYAVKSDGTAGTTDGAPVQGNPITGLNLSFYDLDQARSALINDINAVITGSAAVTQTDRRIKITALLG